MTTLSRSFSCQRGSQQGNSRIAMVAIVAVLVIGAAVYFLYFDTSSEEIPVAPQLPPAAKQAKPDSARDIISTLKESTDVDYNTVYQQAGDFLGEGDVADAQLLYFFAAREGHGPSAFVLASLYDPVGFDPNTSLMDEPDPFQAFKWYNRALAAGESEASARLEALKALVRVEAAADGHLEASQLLLQWEQ